MEYKLPKTNKDYKSILKESWGVDIDTDEIIGQYSPLKDSQGFFSNCTNKEGKLLSYPNEKKPLEILIWGNALKTLKPGNKYRFKIQFAAFDKRIQLNPFLLVTQRDCIVPIETTKIVQDGQELNSESEINNNSRLSSIIKDIYNEKLNQNNPYNVIDIAEAVESLAIDIYSENKRFIYELIQNADDAAIVDQSELVIEIKSGFVVLSHNGKPFDERDLRGLCGIGRGTKRDDEAKTGYKGIGFKSVFGQKDGLVYVKTNELLFRFDRQYILQNGWNSIWGIQKDWEKSNQTKFKSPWQLIPILSESANNYDIDQILNSEKYTVKTAIKIQNEVELVHDINELFSDARFLLFLRKIYKVSLIHGTDKLCISKETDDDAPEILSLFKNDLNISNWYLKTGRYTIPPDIKKELQEDNKSPKKLQEMIRAELSFAFKMEVDKSLSILPTNESCIYTYLPTSVTEFGFPFLVNSNFLVDAGREKIHKDRIWNKWLFKVIGYELINCCAEFAKSDNFNTDYLKILLSNYLPETDPLKKEFNEGLKIGLEKVAFILNNDKQLVRISDIIIDEVEILTKNIVLRNVIIEFINSNAQLGILERNFLPIFPSYEKIKHFGARVFSQTDLKAFLQSNIFSSNHNLSQNYNLLKYLKQLDINDLSGEWNYIVRNNAFIYSNKETLEKIPLVCFPITTYKTDFGSENTLIDQELYNSFSHDFELIEWLKSIGVKEPSEIAYLEKEIIGKIGECINVHTFLNVSEFILKLHLAKDLKEVHYNGLRDLPLKTNRNWANAKECFLPSEYNPVIDFPSNIANLTIVSTDYIGRYNAFEWKTLFVSIGVADDIYVLQNYKIQNTDSDFSGSYFDAAIRYGKEGHTFPHLVNTYPAFITYFTFFAKTTNYQYSLIFWDRLITKHILSVEPNKIIYNSHGPDRDAKVYKLNSVQLQSIDLMKWGYFEHNRVCIPSFVFWHLKNKPCIPTNKKSCYLASEVFANWDRILELGGEYIPIIQISKAVSKEWIQLIGLKSKLLLPDLLKILSAINNDINEKGYFKRDNLKRVGLLYNEIINGINELSIQDEKVINEWAKTSKFLCNDYVPRKNSEVIWLMIEGFNESDDKIPALLIPKNVIVDERTENLINLFGIRIVDKCDYKITDEKEDIKFLIKILEILPIVALLLRSKMKIKDEEEYLKSAFKNIGNFKRLFKFSF